MNGRVVIFCCNREESYPCWTMIELLQPRRIRLQDIPAQKILEPQLLIQDPHLHHLHFHGSKSVYPTVFSWMRENFESAGPSRSITIRSPPCVHRPTRSPHLFDHFRLEDSLYMLYMLIRFISSTMSPLVSMSRARRILSFNL